MTAAGRPGTPRRRWSPGDQVFRTDDDSALTLGKRIGRGGQASVHAISDLPRDAVKIFHEDQREANVDRTRKLIKKGRPVGRHLDLDDWNDHVFLTWPSCIVADTTGLPVGYLMPRMPDEYAQLENLFSRSELLSHAPAANWRYLLRAGFFTARLVALVHESGLVVGDLSPKNIMVSRGGLPTLIDCDSFQFHADSVLVPATGITPDYAAPELGSKDASQHSKETDDFALAVVLSRLLLCGTHPFVGRPVDSDITACTPDELIRHGISRFTPAVTVTVPDKTLPLEMLPPDLIELFRRAFVAGIGEPGARPTARIWASRLKATIDSLVECSSEPRHVYSSAHGDSCPWCQLRERGFMDPFVLPARPGPATGAATVRADGAAPIPPTRRHPIPSVPPSVRSVSPLSASIPTASPGPSVPSVPLVPPLPPLPPSSVRGIRGPVREYPVPDTRWSRRAMDELFGPAGSSSELKLWRSVALALSPMIVLPWMAGAPTVFIPVLAIVAIFCGFVGLDRDRGHGRIAALIPIGATIVAIVLLLLGERVPHL